MLLTVRIFGKYFTVVDERFTLPLRVDGLDAELVAFARFQARNFTLRVIRDLRQLHPLP